MDAEARQFLHDERTSGCRSFGSNIHPSSQTRKISVGVMADSIGSTRNGAMKGDGAVVPNTERVTSKVGNYPGEKSQVEGVTPSFNIEQTGGPQEVKCSWISKSFYQRTPTSEAILQANQASTLLVSPGGRDEPNGIESAAGKHKVQFFSHQTSVFASNNYKKFDADTARMKGRKGGTTEKEKEFTFSTALQVFKSDKTDPEDKINRTENRTENLRMKLCQILGTTSSPKSCHSGSHARNTDEECLPLEQRLYQKENKSTKTIQNSDTIETDSENPDCTPQRPITRSLSRKRTSSKKQLGKDKSGPSSKNTEKHGEKTIFSFEEKWTGRQDAFPNDGSLKKKSQRKNSKIGKNKICLTENDTIDKLHQDTSKTDLPLHDMTTFSLGKIAGGYSSPEYQTKCPQTENINQGKEFYQLPIVNTDQHGELEVSENGNQQECRSNPVIQNAAAKSQDDFPSPTFQPKSPILSFFPDSTPKTGQKEDDVNSPASTERTFSLGSVHTQASEPDFNGLGEQMQLSDMEELKSFIPRKDKSSETEEKEQGGGSSDSSSEEHNFQGYHEGSKVRHASERKSFALHPIKRLCKQEGSKFNNKSPASVSSKGIGDSDWIDEASEQNQDGFVRAVELLALELGKLQSKLKSMTSQKSSEILKSVAEEIHLQLQNVHSQIQTDMGKLTSLGKSKRKRLETRFEDQQKQLRLIYNRFKEEVNQHLQDCRSTVEDLEADRIEIKRTMEKQRVAHKKLLSQVEAAVQIQLDDAQRKITFTQENARGKLLQLKQVVAMCLKEEILN
ncbi:meiosis-specific protein ASY3-like [Glycine soja]|uniref:meiosis-specific protein ASY3-like n=1 Tax=Glycine soja TaxID=3848 RepID=UPI00103C2D7F|nr:meiosis-specific protein ASY3-like [Glycine soja]